MILRKSIMPPVGAAPRIPKLYYCTISGPEGGSYSWATPGTEETCYFGYLNYAGTYTITVYEESPVTGDQRAIGG
jgi:hypothetical protein